MTEEWFKATQIYFIIVTKINNSTIDLCRLDALQDMSEIEENFISIACNVASIIPYTAKLESGKSKISKNDGILKLSKELPFLYTEIKKLVDAHNDMLFKLKMIRNRFEHTPHELKLEATCSSTTNYSDAVFSIDDNEYNIKTQEIIELIKDINNIMIQLHTKFIEHTSNLNDNQRTHPYVYRTKKYNFATYNRLFEKQTISLRDFAEILYKAK